MRNLFGMALIAVAVQAHAQASASPIQMLYLKSTDPKEASAISVDCDGGTAQSEITCRMTQISVRRGLAPQEVQTEQKRTAAQLRKEISEKGASKVLDDFCSGYKEKGKETLRIAKEKGAEITYSDLTRFAEICEKRSVQKLEKFVIDATALASRTCKVSVFQNEPVKYKKVSSRRWVSNVGPSGLCNSIYLYTMEQHEKYDSLWTWTQTRTYVDTSTDFCKEFKTGTKLEFSYEGFDPQLSCERVTFGMF
jgi:hypothetical protein